MSHPGSARRLHDLRVGRHLSRQNLADAAGLSLDAYMDLEAYDDEILAAISLRTLIELARALTMPTHELLGLPAPSHQMSPVELAEQLRTHLDSSGEGADAFANRAGWEVRDFLIDPDRFWSWNLNQLHDVADALGVEWVSAIPIPRAGV